MKSKMTPVIFKNNNNLKLFGILHTPEKPTKEVGIIILSPGIKSRVAPHRLYVKMAAHFCELGFQVLRFDPEGLGDSEGEIDERFAADVYGTIQLGRFINDTISAMDWMQLNYNIKCFILTGLCGGAITGLLTGAEDQRVEAILGLGIPVILDSSNIDHSKYITKGQLKGLRDGYLRKILNPWAWIRFFLLKSDFKIMFKSLLQPFLKKSSEASEKAIIQNNGNFNPHFPKAFHEVLTKRNILLVFSEADRLYWEFEEKYMFPYKEDLERIKHNLSIHIVKEANHIFSFKIWQEDMLEKTATWLLKNNK